MRLTRDDIAALEVIADPRARLQHRLNTNNINIRWVLKRVPQPRPSGECSRAGSSRSPSCGGGSESGGCGGAAATAGATSTCNVPAESSNDESRPEAGDGGGSASRSRRGGGTPVGTTGRGIVPPPPPVFAPAPTPLLTLNELDTARPVSDDPSEVLLNSPRSAFVVLHNGLSMEELCAVSAQKFFNDALLDGVTVETAHMRIAAENDRRRHKFGVLLDEYRALCAAASREDVVAAIRNHRFGFEEEQHRNAAELSQLTHYAHSGKLDLTVLDTDCVDVLVRSRNRALGDIRRVLNQRERVIMRNVEREHAVQEKELSQERESRRVQEAQQRQREQRSRELQAKRAHVQNRVRLLLKSQDERREMRREALVEERTVHEQRAAERKALDRHASLQLIEFREKRRRKARVTQEQQRERRREEILAKQEFVTKIHERQLQLRREELQQRSVEFNRTAIERRQAIRELSAQEQAERKARMQAVEDEAERRARDFAHIREARLQAKREAAQARAVRGAATRLNAEAIKAQRLAELEAAHREKLQSIEELQEERREQLAFEKEIASQVRLEKSEEKKRSQTAMEFAYIGYMNSNEAKKTWMNREELKRRTLSGHVRQEREAMQRARDAVLAQLEAEEVERRKREDFHHHNSLNRTM